MKYFITTILLLLVTFLVATRNVSFAVGDGPSERQDVQTTVEWGEAGEPCRMFEEIHAVGKNYQPMVGVECTK